MTTKIINEGKRKEGSRFMLANIIQDVMELSSNA
jgi:hypothetical protein